MSDEDITSGADGLFGSFSRRDAMKAGALVAGGLAIGSASSGTAVAEVKSQNGENAGNLGIFLKIDGIEGESRDPRHKDEIDILSWSWGSSNSGSMHRARGGARGAATFDDLLVTKPVDKATPHLWLSVASGKHYPEATLVVRRAGDEPVEFLTIELENILISSIETGGAVGHQQTESVSLNFAQYKMTYTPQEPDGSAGDSVGPLGWNIQRNEEV